MKKRPADHQWYQSHYANSLATEVLSAEQISAVKELAKTLQHWKSAHPFWDRFLFLLPIVLYAAGILFSITVVAGADLSLVVKVPLVTFLNGFFGYGLIVYSLHEVSGHASALSKRGAFDKFLWFFGRNLCRFSGSDPDFYAKSHPLHHAFLATEKDATFTSYVNPKLFFASLLPGAGFLWFNGFQVNHGSEWSKSRFVSFVLSIVFAAIVSFIMALSMGWAWASLITFILSPWFAFALDRLRETLEHVFMPQHPVSGSRELGFSVLGQIISGGPVGQPYHLTHHLCPQSPWWAQNIIAFKMRQQMTPAQKEFFAPKQSITLLRVLTRISSSQNVEVH